MARKLMLPRGIFDQVNAGDKEEWNKTHNNLSRKVSRKDRRKAERLAKRGKNPKSRADQADQKTSKQAQSVAQTHKTQAKPTKVQVDSDGEEELDENMSEDETWAALRALKNKKRQLPSSKKDSSGPAAKKTKPAAPKQDYSNFKSAVELEQEAKDEQDAKYYAKMLGQKSLKLKSTEKDGLEDILGDLDFDRFSDLEGASDQKNQESDQDQEVSQDSDQDSEPFIENPWKDDTLSEGDYDTEPESDKEPSNAKQPKKSRPEPRANKSGTSSASEGGSDDEPFIENPWGKDDTLTESDFTDNTDLSGDEASQSKPGKDAQEEDSDSEPFIENPWTDDSLSEGDFDSDSDVDEEPMTAEETMALLAKHKLKAKNEPSAGKSESGSADDSDFDSEPESVDDNMDEDETWAALKALKAKKAGKQQQDPQDPSSEDSDDFDSEVESLDDNMDEDETWAALKALKAKKSGAPVEPAKATKEPKKELKKESRKENPFLPAVKNQAKYVPPSKRKLLDQQRPAETEETVKLRRQLKGVFNKLTEANIGAIINEIETLFEANPKHLVGSLITQIVLESVVAQGTLQEAFLVVHSGLITALYRTIGVNFGAQFIQDVVQEFFKHYSRHERNRDATNVLMLIMGCYALGMVSSKLIYDLVGEFLTEITEPNTELLLLVVRTCGSQIRADDPTSLKEIIIDLQKKMGALDKDSMTVRNKILVESVMNLKNNRQKVTNEQLHALQQRMRKFLGGVKGVASEPLQVTLSDIRNIETRGKWWIVGAAYNSGGGIDKSLFKPGTHSEQEPDYDEKEVDSFIKSEPNWLALARKQRLNTDVRRAIFIAIMGAEDFVDACMRIDKLRLKSKQDREIVHVVLHCLANEQTYNPYYALVAAKQCTKHTMRKAFQFSLWDYLNQIQDSEAGGDIHKAMNYARFYAALVAQDVMTLDVLKVVDFLTSNDTVRVFVEIFFVFLFKAVGKNAEAKKRDILGNQARDARALARIITMTKEPSVLQGVRYVQPQVLASAATADAKKKEKERIRWCSDMTLELISQLSG